MTATVLDLATRQPMRHVTIERLNGSIMARAGFLPGDAGAPWAWVQETVAWDTGCSEEDVHVLETDDGDLITADGLPVARIAL